MGSWRMGGLDITAHGLSTQTFKNFELVFIDELYPYRKEEVKEYFEPLKVTKERFNTKSHGGGTEIN